MSRPLATVAGAKKMVKKTYSELDVESSEFKEKVILLVSTFKGTNMKELAKVVGYPRSVVEAASKKFRTVGVWKNNMVNEIFMNQKAGGYKTFLNTHFNPIIQS